jgi:hypothetical protein
VGIATNPPFTDERLQLPAMAPSVLSESERLDRVIRFPESGDHSKNDGVTASNPDQYLAGGSDVANDV